jgi:ankyrin repeat protein
MEVLIAARLGDTETASALLAAGADVNGRNDQGCVTAALCVCPGGTATTKGSSRRSTALQLACLFGHTQTAEMLVAIGADLNSKDNVGYGQRMVSLRRRHFARRNAG